MSMYIHSNGKQSGPIEESEVISALAAGRLSPNDLGIRPGDTNWQPLAAMFAAQNASAGAYGISSVTQRDPARSHIPAAASQQSAKAWAAQHLAMPIEVKLRGAGIVGKVVLAVVLLGIPVGLKLVGLPWPAFALFFLFMAALYGLLLLIIWFSGRKNVRYLEAAGVETRGGKKHAWEDLHGIHYKEEQGAKVSGGAAGGGLLGIAIAAILSPIINAIIYGGSDRITAELKFADGTARVPPLIVDADRIHTLIRSIPGPKSGEGHIGDINPLGLNAGASYQPSRPNQQPQTAFPQAQSYQLSQEPSRQAGTAPQVPQYSVPTPQRSKTTRNVLIVAGLLVAGLFILPILLALGYGAMSYFRISRSPKTAAASNSSTGNSNSAAANRGSNTADTDTVSGKPLLDKKTYEDRSRELADLKTAAKPDARRKIKGKVAIVSDSYGLKTPTLALLSTAYSDGISPYDLETWSVARANVARTLEELDTLIRVMCTKKRLGTYVAGGRSIPAFGLKCNVEVIDHKTAVLFAKKSFGPGELEDLVSISSTSSEYTVFSGLNDAKEYVKNFPRE